MDTFDIIKGLIDTEKAQRTHDLYAMELRTQGMKDSVSPKVTMRVDIRANKYQIREAVEKLFPKVKVPKVNTSHLPGKARRKRTLAAGKTSDWKKAVITLKEGSVTDITGNN